jgi:hypothetical protein
VIELGESDQIAFERAEHILVSVAAQRGEAVAKIKIDSLGRAGSADAAVQFRLLVLAEYTEHRTAPHVESVERPVRRHMHADLHRDRRLTHAAIRDHFRFRDNN